LKDVWGKHPLHTRFNWIRGEITDYTGTAADHIFSNITPDLTPGKQGFEKFYPYAHKLGVMEEDAAELAKLNPEIRALYLQHLPQYQEFAKETSYGKYNVISSNVMAFTVENLKVLLQNNGFECSTIFLVNALNGHKVGCIYPDGTKEEFNNDNAYQVVAFAKLASNK